MKKKIKSSDKILTLEQLQDWEERGKKPDEFKNDMTFSTSNSVEQVKSYMLAHQHFMEAIKDIISDKNNDGKNTYEEIYVKLLDFCNSKSQVAFTWNKRKHRI